MNPVPLLDLKAQYATIRDDVTAAMAEVIEAQAFVLGPVVERLETALAELSGASHAVACASGTDAVLLPLRALDPEPGDEAVVPAFTFFATAGAASNAGLRPRFCDVDPDTFNVTAECLAPALTPRTRVVIPVHLFGQMAPMEELVGLLDDRDIPILEDAAQAVGATRSVPVADAADAADVADVASVGPHARVDSSVGIEGSSGAGSVGWAGAFSFFPTKNLGAFGEGGLITTSDADLAERLRKLRVHGGRQMYHHEEVGTNSRLHALQAAVLLAKLPHLSTWTEARRAHARRYDEWFADVPEVLPPPTLEGNDHVFNQYTLRVRRRDELRSHLADQGIGSGLYYPVPLHLQACYSELGGREGDHPVAEALCRQVVSLPIYPELLDEQIDRVASEIRRFYGHAG